MWQPLSMAHGQLMGQKMGDSVLRMRVVMADFSF